MTVIDSRTIPDPSPDVVVDPIALRDAIVAGLEKALPAKVKVEAHGGTFDEAELKRWMVAAPAVRVAIPGIERTRRQSNGQLVLPVRFAAVIITKSSANPKLDRGDAAMQLATLVSLIVDGNTWGLDDISKPEDLDARNEYTGRIDQTGIALWQVMWCQPIRMGDKFSQPIGKLTKLFVNRVLTFDADGPTGADPLKDPPSPDAPAAGDAP